MGVANQNLKCSKALTLYRNIAIFFLPLVAFVIYIVTSLAYAQYYFDYFNGTELNGKKTEIIYGCLEFLNGVLVVLSCIHLAFFFQKINKLKKSINTLHIDKETD